MCKGVSFLLVDELVLDGTAPECVDWIDPVGFLATNTERSNQP